MEGPSGMMKGEENGPIFLSFQGKSKTIFPYKKSRNLSLIVLRTK
jgi:hypothetical protein